MSDQRVEDFLLPKEEKLTLPSGLVVTVRPMNRLEGWASMGSLPGSLANIVAGESSDKPSQEELVSATYRLIARMVISPPFAWPPEPGKHDPSRLQTADVEALDNLAGKWFQGGGGADLTTFRKGKPGALAAAGASGGDVRPAAQRDLATETP